jgi:hypothetical protein
VVTAALGIADPSSKPFGKSYLDWCVSWWEWLLSISLERNPALDMTGRFARLNQPHRNVLFLCQTYEGMGIVPFRILNVGPGTSVFMPIINYLSTLPSDGLTEAELTSTARRKIDSVQEIVLELDGKDVEFDFVEHRFVTSIFHIRLPRSNLLNMKEGVAACVSDGYWVMLEPIGRRVNIRTSASCSSGRVQISAKYLIDPSMS